MSVNAQTVSAGEAHEVLLAGWQAQVTGNLTASWMLHGRPGVGKSQLVSDLARQIGARLFDVRLTTIEPQDLRGLFLAIRWNHPVSIHPVPIGGINFSLMRDEMHDFTAAGISTTGVTVPGIIAESPAGYFLGIKIRETAY